MTAPDLSPNLPPCVPATVRTAVAEVLADVPVDRVTAFEVRLHRWWADLVDGLDDVHDPSTVADLARRLAVAAATDFRDRPDDLHRLDQRRLVEPDWLQSPRMVGYAAYTERFAGDLAGVADRIGYLEELGVTYLHLMPLLAPRDGEEDGGDDGGYAVADHRRVRPDPTSDSTYGACRRASDGDWFRPGRQLAMRRQPMTGHRDHRRRPCAVLLLVVGLALAGCTTEGRDQIRDQVGQAASDAEREIEDAVSEIQQEPVPPDGVDPEPTAAPATEVAEPTPDPTAQASPEPATEDTGEQRDWLPLALGLLALLALLVVLLLVVGAIRRRRAARRVERARIRSELGDLLGTGRWVLDQGSVEVQRITEPTQLQRSWQAVRERLVGIEERAAGLLVDVEGDPLAHALRNLSASSESLRSVLDGTVSLREGAAPDPDLVSDNRLAVQQRRRDFGAALDRIATFR